MDRRLILHSDLNCFYASVEANEHPKLKGCAMAVCGSTEDRHGIVLTATYPAKRQGVKTGMANWQAKQICPALICVPPHYELYLKYSRIVRDIYRRYSDDVEAFGMDECWLSLPYGRGPASTGAAAAEEIRRTVYRETGLTVSIGVSFSKIFAKLGSDMKKPDAVTVVDEANYRSLVWPLDVSELLYVGRATRGRLARVNIRTIGELAACDPEILRAKLGKNGVMLWKFANGCDNAAVMPENYIPPIKSIGHGTTCVVDLSSDYEVWRVLYALAQDLGHRMRREAFLAGGIEVSVRDRDLGWMTCQCPLEFPTRSPLLLARAGYRLFLEKYPWRKPVRALTIRGIRLVSETGNIQVGMLMDQQAGWRRQSLDDAVDEIRGRFGETALQAASLMGDTRMARDKCEMVPMPAIMYQ